MDKVIIELNNDEAELFKKFRQFQNIWEKIFMLKDGSAELHFDKDGNLRKIEYKYYQKLSTLEK